MLNPRLRRHSTISWSNALCDAMVPAETTTLTWFDAFAAAVTVTDTDSESSFLLPLLVLLRRNSTTGGNNMQKDSSKPRASCLLLGRLSSVSLLPPLSENPRVFRASPSATPETSSACPGTSWSEAPEVFPSCALYPTRQIFDSLPGAALSVRSEILRLGSSFSPSRTFGDSLLGWAHGQALLPRSCF